MGSRMQTKSATLHKCLIVKTAGFIFFNLIYFAFFGFETQTLKQLSMRSFEQKRGGPGSPENEKSGKRKSNLKGQNMPIPSSAADFSFNSSNNVTGINRQNTDSSAYSTYIHMGRFSCCHLITNISAMVCEPEELGNVEILLARTYSIRVPHRLENPRSESKQGISHLYSQSYFALRIHKTELTLLVATQEYCHDEK